MKLGLAAPVVAGAIIAVIALAAASAPARDSAATVEGVSSLSYAPKPFYDDLSRMRVRFTTTARARPGWEYVVSLIILGPDTSPENRYTSLVISTIPSLVVRPQRILGAPGKTYTVWLRADSLPTLRKYFCHGRATLRVYATAIRGRGGSPNLRTLNFRILHAP